MAWETQVVQLLLLLLFSHRQFLRNLLSRPRFIRNFKGLGNRVRDLHNQEQHVELQNNRHCYVITQVVGTAMVHTVG